MKTDYKNLSMWEAAMVTWSMVGVILVAVVMFNLLTPQKQIAVKQAFQIFDIRDGVNESIEILEFAINIPNEFYKEFYIAFEQVATLPPETFEFPVEVATRLYNNSKTAINILTEQVAEGYASRNEFRVATASSRELAYDGKIMGMMIEAADTLSTVTITQQTPYTEVLEIPYSYTKPKVEIRKIKFYEN